jgi:hypothetical protein
MPIGDIFQVVSLILIGVSATLAWVSIQKYRNSRGIDFVLEAEGAIDPLYHKLVGEEPALIRNAYRSFGIQDLSDDDCRVFPFMHVIYSHISRMYFILSARQLDYGLTQVLREEMTQAWVKELVQYRDHPAMVAMHRHAVRTGNFNSAFLRLAGEVFGDPDKSQSESNEGEVPSTSPPSPQSVATPLLFCPHKTFGIPS